MREFCYQDFDEVVPVLRRNGEVSKIYEDLSFEYSGETVVIEESKRGSLDDEMGAMVYISDSEIESPDEVKHLEESDYTVLFVPGDLENIVGKTLDYLENERDEEDDGMCIDFSINPPESRKDHYKFSNVG